jgi:L-Ala-D/L-Glu epimerase
VKIDQVRHSRVEVALHETFRTAIRSTDSISAIRVEVRAGGRIGVGFATATPAITGDTVESIEAHLDDVVIPYLLGRDVPSIRDIPSIRDARDIGETSHQADDPAQREVADSAIVGGLGVHPDDQYYVLGAQSNALFGIPVGDYEDWAMRCSSGTAGIDLALHDLVFGRPALPAKLVTSVTIGAGSVDEMVATAYRRVAAGFRVVKAKLGADPQHDAQRLISLAQALGAVGNVAVRNVEEQNAVAPGSVQLWVDANQGWTVAQALEIFDAALDANVLIGVFEQPTPAADLDALRQVRIGVQQRCHARGLAPVPVVADESARTLADVDRIIAAGSADVINVKFMKFGGITGSGKAVEKARAAGLGVLVGSMMEHPHSVAAAVRFASALGGVHDLDAGWWAKDTSPLQYGDGQVSVAPS